MIEYNLTNESTDDTCTFINFDDAINKIINDSNIKGLEMTINNMKEKVINSILDVGYCIIKVKDVLFTLIVTIDGMENYCFCDKQKRKITVK